MANHSLIYDWNSHPHGLTKPKLRFVLHDETLRDGLQTPTGKIPTIAEQKKFIHLLVKLGIGSIDLGMPVASQSVASNVLILAKEALSTNPNLNLSCAGRTIEHDIKPIIDLSQQVGIPIEALIFIGSSPIRQYVEAWDFKDMLRKTHTAISFAKHYGLKVTFVTEDTTRAKPAHLRQLFLTALDAGATRLCLCDTVGNITPTGITNLIQFTKHLLQQNGFNSVELDFHGHMDRGLGVWNSISALEAGVTRVHACALGMGERCGNTPMDQLLVNLKLLGWIDNDLSGLSQYIAFASTIFNIKLPLNYPVFGKSAFETATGIHAAAILKAIQKKRVDLMDDIYSGVPAHWFGRHQVIKIGPMSGTANVVCWLQQQHLAIDDNVIKEILKFAKQSDHVLSNREIKTVMLKMRRAN